MLCLDFCLDLILDFLYLYFSLLLFQLCFHSKKLFGSIIFLRKKNFSEKCISFRITFTFQIEQIIFTKKSFIKNKIFFLFQIFFPFQVVLTADVHILLCSEWLISVRSFSLLFRFVKAKSTIFERVIRFRTKLARLGVSPNLSTNSSICSRGCFTLHLSIL